MAARTSCWWASSTQSTMTSSSSTAPFTSKPSRPRMLAPASPMVVVRRPRVPGTLSNSTRRRMEKAAVGERVSRGSGVVAMRRKVLGHRMAPLVECPAAPS